MPTFFFTNLLTQLPLALLLIATMSIGAGSFIMLHWDGALKEDGPDRERLLAYLAMGGDWRVRYTAIIQWALNQADRWLSDADKPVRSFHWLTGDNRPWPCWSSWAFDRCALIAVVYPIAALVLTWVATGDAGDIGAALGMPPHSGVWQRFLGAGTFALGLAGSSADARSITIVIVIIIVAVTTHAVAAAVAVAGTVAGLIANVGALARVIPGAFAVTITIEIAVSGAIPTAIPGAIAVLGNVAGLVAAAVGISITLAVIFVTNQASKKNLLGWFWVVFWPFMTTLCYLGVWATIHNDRTNIDVAVLFVMLVMVPLLNVPFDFVAIGFTRGLLRRGVAPGASTLLPFMLGLLDAGIGLVLQLLLATTLIAGLQAADTLMLRAGAQQPVIDVPERLATLGESPYSTENAWIYITLFPR